MATKIADIVGVKVISLDEALAGYAQFDAGAPTKFVIDPHPIGQIVNDAPPSLLPERPVRHGYSSASVSKLQLAKRTRPTGLTECP